MKNTCGKCLHWDQVSLGSDDGRCRASLPAWAITRASLRDWQHFNSTLAEWCSTFTPRSQVKRVCDPAVQDLSAEAMNTIAVRMKHDLTNLLNYRFLTKEQHDQIWDRVSTVLGKDCLLPKG